MAKATSDMALLKLKSITVHLDPRSTCSQTALLVLAEKGIEDQDDIKYTVNAMNLGKKDQKSAENLARHPFGVVPTLEAHYEGVSKPLYVPECDALCRFVSAAVPGASQMPTDIGLKAHHDKLMSYYPSYMKPAYLPGYKELELKRRYGWGKPDIDIAIKSFKRTNEVFAILEQEFNATSGDYFCGEWSLADARLFPGFTVLDYLAQLDGMLKDKPGLRGWYDRMLKRPAWKTVLAHRKKAYPDFPPCEQITPPKEVASLFA